MDQLGDIGAVAKLLGVSRPRVFQLIEEDPTFPKEVQTFGRMRIWHLPDVEGWAERPDVKERRTTPGRPRRRS